MDKLVNELDSLPVGEIKVVPAGTPSKPGTVRPRICSCQCAGGGAVKHWPQSANQAGPGHVPGLPHDTVPRGRPRCTTSSS